MKKSLSEDFSYVYQDATHTHCTSQCSDLAQLAPISKGQCISYWCSVVDIQWLTLGIMLMMAHRPKQLSRVRELTQWRMSFFLTCKYCRIGNFQSSLFNTYSNHQGKWLNLKLKCTLLLCFQNISLSWWMSRRCDSVKPQWLILRYSFSMLLLRHMKNHTDCRITVLHGLLLFSIWVWRRVDVIKNKIWPNSQSAKAVANFNKNTFTHIWKLCCTFFLLRAFNKKPRDHATVF